MDRLKWGKLIKHVYNSHKDTVWVSKCSFWYRLTWVHRDKGPLNGLSSFIKWDFVTFWTHAKLEMWANAQRDGRPVEYRRRPLFNAAKFGWRPILECRAVTLPKRETRWNLQGCPKLTKRSQPLVHRSSPHCKDMWRRYSCLTSFFPIIDMCLSCKVVGWCPDGGFFRRVFGSCISSKPHAAHFRPAF